MNHCKYLGCVNNSCFDLRNGEMTSKSNAGWERTEVEKCQMHGLEMSVVQKAQGLVFLVCDNVPLVISSGSAKAFSAPKLALFFRGGKFTAAAVGNESVLDSEHHVKASPQHKTYEAFLKPSTTGRPSTPSPTSIRSETFCLCKGNILFRRIQLENQTNIIFFKRTKVQ